MYLDYLWNKDLFEFGFVFNGTYLAFLGLISGWQQALYRSIACVGVSASVSSAGASHSSVTSGARAGDVWYPSEFSWKIKYTLYE